MVSTLARVRRSALALTTLALAATPASALAQSASDDVYQDPFANQGQQNGTAGTQSSGTNSGSSAGNSGSSMQQVPSTVPTQNQGTTTGSSGTTTTAPQSEAAATQTVTPANELPRTGDDAGTTALVGLGLLLAGGGLRLRLRARVD
jgi:LPXTG-motif cell wall-anchored protein